MNQLRKLMSAALVVRINDFVIYRVSTSQRKTVLKEFVMGERSAAPPRARGWHRMLAACLAVSLTRTPALSLYLSISVSVCVCVSIGSTGSVTAWRHMFACVFACLGWRRGGFGTTGEARRHSLVMDG